MSDLWLEGAISIEAAIESGNRDIQKVYYSGEKWSATIRRIKNAAESANIAIEPVDPTTIDQLASGRTHGGLVAKVGPRRFQALEELLSEQTPTFVVMLDGIEDPYNFGQAVRTLYAAGVHGLVLRSRNWMTSAAVVARASAGATERMPVATVNDPKEATGFFRKNGLLIVLADPLGALSVYETELSCPLFLLIGGEKRGIMRSARDEADLRVQVPYGRTFQHAMGTSATAGILAFEIMRQRLQVDKS